MTISCNNKTKTKTKTRTKTETKNKDKNKNKIVYEYIVIQLISDHTFAAKITILCTKHSKFKNWLSLNYYF